MVGRAVAALTSYDGRDVLDVGCGTGYHLPRLARAAATVTGVEPHPDLLAIARRRTRRLGGVRVLPGLAEDLPLADASVDVALARWAYYFGPGCEPGLRELARVVRPGGTACLLDNDPTTSTFGRWFRRGFPEVDPETVRRFWAEQGWRHHPVTSCWRFESRADLEAVVRIELPPAAADAALAEHAGLEVDYAVSLWTRSF